jgi:Arc/MetJ-type ribon-helix-helix transcriptional regulator
VGQPVRPRERRPAPDIGTATVRTTIEVDPDGACEARLDGGSVDIGQPGVETLGDEIIDVTKTMVRTHPATLRRQTLRAPVDNSRWRYGQIAYPAGVSSMVIGMAKTEKVTVTLPIEQVAAIKARVLAGELDSVSGFVQHAVRLALDDATAFRAMAEMDLEASGGQLTPEEQAWIDAVIGRGEPPRDPGPYPYPPGTRP